MKTSFAILITASPLETASDTAFQFIKAVLRKDHIVKSIFFYQDGVYHGNRLAYLENSNLLERWPMLSQQYDVELILCSASAARRGILDKAQSNYFEKDTENLRVGYKITSLSRWFEVLCASDRVMIFGDSN